MTFRNWPNWASARLMSACSLRSRPEPRRDDWKYAPVPRRSAGEALNPGDLQRPDLPPLGWQAGLQRPGNEGQSPVVFVLPWVRRHRRHMLVGTPPLLSIA